MLRSVSLLRIIDLKQREKHVKNTSTHVNRKQLWNPAVDNRFIVQKHASLCNLEM